MDNRFTNFNIVYNLIQKKLKEGITGLELEKLYKLIYEIAFIGLVEFNESFIDKINKEIFESSVYPVFNFEDKENKNWIETNKKKYINKDYTISHFDIYIDNRLVYNNIEGFCKTIVRKKELLLNISKEKTENTLNILKNNFHISNSESRIFLEKLIQMNAKNNSEYDDILYDIMYSLQKKDEYNKIISDLINKKTLWESYVFDKIKKRQTSNMNF